MKVFLSWSGQKSKAVAEALRDWLPSVIQEIEPFMSERDIAAGARWLNEIDQELEGTNFAIVCVTRENQSASWLNFEGGAVAKVIQASRVVPLAIDLTVADVKPPLGHFQAKDISKAGILAVLESLNEHAERPLPNVASACEKWWPDLEPKLQSAATAAEAARPVRGERELLEEILASVRSLGERTVAEVQASVRDRLADADARAAVSAHDAHEARRVAEAAQHELAARRQRDGVIADRLLQDVSKALPPGSGGRAVVLDDYLQPRVQVQTVAPLCPEDRDEVLKRAARFGFEVELVPSIPLE